MGGEELGEGVMAVKRPSALHQKGLKNYTKPDASSVVTQEGTLDRLRQTTAVGSECVHYRPEPRANMEQQLFMIVIYDGHLRLIYLLQQVAF